MIFGQGNAINKKDEPMRAHRRGDDLSHAVCPLEN